jgi:hypothetical protein
MRMLFRQENVRRDQQNGTNLGRASAYRRIAALSASMPILEFYLWRARPHTIKIPRDDHAIVFIRTQEGPNATL